MRRWEAAAHSYTDLCTVCRPPDKATTWPLRGGSNGWRSGLSDRLTQWPLYMLYRPAQSCSACTTRGSHVRLERDSTKSASNDH